MTLMEAQDPFLAFGPLPDQVNMAQLLPQSASKHPERDALLEQGSGPVASWRRVSYAELEARACAIARGLAQRGVRHGDRICLFVKPGIELIAITYALFKLGAVPVLADPGMGRKSLLNVVRRMRPRVFIGVPMAHAVRLAFRSAFASVELAITVGRRVFWGGPTLAQVERGSDDALDLAGTKAEDTAAILFTSGSTGPPKGVVYTHGMFHAQVLALQALYGFESGAIDLACFPLFALFDVAFGMTTAIPDMDASHPGRCDPAKIVRALQETGASTSFGSPAIWRRVVPHCIQNDIQLSSLKRVLIAGAPIPRSLVEQFHRVLPADGDVHTPYGATESLPVSSISGREILEVGERTRNGGGTCVGKAASGIDMRLIEISDEVHANWSDARVVQNGELGEVCVRGPVVTHSYAEDAAATAAAKMRPVASESGLWHRMGDIASVDVAGRLWIAGRKAHRLTTPQGARLPVPTENVYNEHAAVFRSALVGVGLTGHERPYLIIECEAGQLPSSHEAEQALFRELDALGAAASEDVHVEGYLIHSGFPVDVRHNAKIHREELKAWAEAQLAINGEGGAL
ncbi:MAG: acyl-CoA synthetase (AMP-forming)/AMP-acid ligase II [Planctomycetota bacterium]|jgi:acyl-CoA synthetase (AMP-forming)/AMP-acid ligase II